MPDVKGSMPAPASTDTHPARPTETPKDLKKRVRGLDKSLTNVHERLVQTEKQIFDLERSYLEETRLYGNVLQGWDAYLDIKGKGTGDNILRGAKRGTKREAPPADDAEDGEEEIGEAYLVFVCCGLTVTAWTSVLGGYENNQYTVHACMNAHHAAVQQLAFVVACRCRAFEWKPQHDKAVIIVLRASPKFKNLPTGDMYV